LAQDKLPEAMYSVSGILLLAKEKGILEKIASLLEKLRTEGYWLSDNVTPLYSPLITPPSPLLI